MSHLIASLRQLVLFVLHFYFVNIAWLDLIVLQSMAVMQIEKWTIFTLSNLDERQSFTVYISKHIYDVQLKNKHKIFVNY